MRRDALSFLNIVHWPIWLKIASLVGVALVVLAVPVYITVRTATVETALENAERSLQINGTQRVESILNLVGRAQTTLQAFASDEVNRQLLLSAFLEDDGGTPPTIQMTTQINQRLSNGLLDPATTLYDNIRLIDADGSVVTAHTLGDRNFANAAILNQSLPIVYQAGLAAEAGGGSRTVSITQVSGVTSVDFVEIVRRRDGQLAGLIAARLANSQMQSALNVAGQSNIGTTLLVTSPDVIIASVQAGVENNSEPEFSLGAERALSGQLGLERYRLPSGAEVIGYYTPLSDLRLALVSELPLVDIEAQALGFFTTRSFVLAAGAVGLGIVMVAMLAILNHLISPPLVRLRQATQALAQGDFAQPVPDSARGDEIGALAASFVVMRDQVQSLVGELQARLEARARDIDTTQAISSFAATQRDLRSLLDRVVDLIVERFPNIYHAQIFLVDSDRKYAILRASTGEAGRALLERGHRLAVGSVSVIGQATGQRRVIVARDTAYSPVHRQNALLPDTKAELAIPLFFGDEVTGALDVQSIERDAFTPDQVSVLQTVANQIAVAIQTAQFYEESVHRLEQIERVNRMATMRAWQEYMHEQRARQMSSHAGVEIENDLSQLRHQALTTGTPAVGEPTSRQTIPVTVPIQIAGQVIGVVEWELTAADFGGDKLELAQELANRLAISLDNARLFQESRRAAEREHLVNEIAARLTAQSNVHDILQTAVREVGQALRAPQVSIRLQGLDVKDGNGKHTNGSHTS